MTFWRALVRQSSGVVALTAHTARETAELGFRGPIEVIPNHRPWALFGGARPNGAAVRAELGIPEAAQVVGFVGHLVSQKDPVRFAAVGRRILELLPGVHLLIVGDGPLRAELEKALSSLPPTAVHVHGHADDVVPLLGQIDVLLSVSRVESMTGGLIEALMAGCAVVTVDVDGMEELVVPTVGSVAADDEGLARAAVLLLNDRESLRRVKASAAQWGRSFSTETVAGSYRQFFEPFLLPSATAEGAE